MTDVGKGHGPACPWENRLSLHQLLIQFPRSPRFSATSPSGVRPYVIAEWCYETARATAAFYRDCPVLAAPADDLRSARLHLVDAAARSLRNGLGLLGIGAPEQM